MTVPDTGSGSTATGSTDTGSTATGSADVGSAGAGAAAPSRVLPEQVLALLSARTVLVADPASAGQAVVHMIAETRTEATETELRAAGLALEREAPRTATDIAYRWLLSYASAATRRSYASDLRQFDRWCARHGIDDALGAHRSNVQAFDRHLAGDVTHTGTDGATTVVQAALKPRSRARKLAALSSYFDYALDEGLIAGNPVTRARRPAVSDRDRDLSGLDAGEMARLFTAAADYGLREHALVCLLGLVGLRVAEATGLNIEDLGERRGKHGLHQVITVHGKGAKIRILPLPPRTLHAVRAAIGARTGGPVLITSTGARMSTNQARSTMKVLARRAGVGIRSTAGAPDVWLHPHTLRHAWITLARDAGVPLEDVQDAVGHADPRQTRAYDTDRGQLDRSPTYILEQLLTRSHTGGDTDPGHHQPPPTATTATATASAAASVDSPEHVSSAEHVNSAEREETSP